MNHGKSHLVWMGIIYVVLLIVSKIVGVGLTGLFLVACFFMMVAMMFGMNHNDNNQPPPPPKDKE